MLEKIIKDLKVRQKALQKQLWDLPEDPNSIEDEIWAAEVGAKLELVNELLNKFDKPKKK